MKTKQKQSPLLFSFQYSSDFAEQVATLLSLELSPIEERNFEDGEHKVRPLVDVKGRDVFVFQSLFLDEHESINDKLCKLLFFSNCLKQNMAKTVTVVTPYLAYSRKDQRTKEFDPVTTSYLGQLFEASGCDRLLTLDVHNVSAFQNSFRIPTVHIESKELFASEFSDLIDQDESWVVISPDIGGVKRAESLKDSLESKSQKSVGLGFFEKKRSFGQLSGELFAGDVLNKNVLIFDDIIATGETLERAVVSCKENGADKVFVAATHGLFVGDANQTLSQLEIEKICITDSTSEFNLLNEEIRKKLDILATAPIISHAVRKLIEE